MEESQKGNIVAAEDRIQLALEQVLVLKSLMRKLSHFQGKKKELIFYLPNCLQPPPHGIYTTVFFQYDHSVQWKYSCTV